MWHLPESNFTVIVQATYLYDEFENFKNYYYISQGPMS